MESHEHQRRYKIPKFSPTYLRKVIEFLLPEIWTSFFNDVITEKSECLVLIPDCWSKGKRGKVLVTVLRYMYGDEQKTQFSELDFKMQEIFGACNNQILSSKLEDTIKFICKYKKNVSRILIQSDNGSRGVFRCRGCRGGIWRKMPNLGVKRQNAGVEIQKYSKFVSNS